MRLGKQVRRVRTVLARRVARPLRNDIIWDGGNGRSAIMVLPHLEPPLPLNAEGGSSFPHPSLERVCSQPKQLTCLSLSVSCFG